MSNISLPDYSHFEGQAHSLLDVKIATTSFSHNVSWHDNGIQPQISLPPLPSSAGGELFEYSSLCMRARMHIVAGTAWHAQCPICRDVQVQSPCCGCLTWWRYCKLWGESNMHESPDSSREAGISLGMLSQQLPSQPQGTEGPALGRRSETGDSGAMWQGRLW